MGGLATSKIIRNIEYEVVSNRSFELPNLSEENIISYTIERNVENKSYVNRKKRSPVGNNFEIQIWNNIGMVRSIKTKENNTQISLQGLANGVYSVHLIKNGERLKPQKLIIDKR